MYPEFWEMYDERTQPGSEPPPAEPALHVYIGSTDTTNGDNAS